MAQRNVAVKYPTKTHEGAPAIRVGAEKQLRRSVLSCLLWEKEFYEDGEDISQRVAALVPQVAPEKVALLAIEAREKMKLRHIPLFLVREMARYDSHRPFVKDALAKVVQRGDEPAEFLAIYFGKEKQPIAHSVRKGLGLALQKFNEYELAKYDRAKAVKLRDVFRLVRPHPANAVQSELWRKAVKGELATPDTWEVALSAEDGIPKKEKWERLLAENRLGALALLRNLRNLHDAGVDRAPVRAALEAMSTYRVLPFRFIAAARATPHWEPVLESKMFESVAGLPKLRGHTAILVDVSGSMDNPLSARSDMRRMDAGYGVAVVGRELCDEVDIFSFSNRLESVPPRRGFALRDALDGSQSHGGTYLGDAVRKAWEKLRPDRMVVITDEQAHDHVTYPDGLERGYVINVASYRNGVGYGKWTHIDGFSEAVFAYIAALESEEE